MFTLFTSAVACGAGTNSNVDSASELDGGADNADATTQTSSDGGIGTHLTGTLGKLGATKPTVSSLFISNSGETLIYMSSAPLTCEQLTVSRWLGSVTSGAQVVEIVIRGAPKTGTVAVPPGEVNYAEGGKSSAYEVNASTGSITFTKADPTGVVEGTLTASYAGGETLEGTFHAEFCDQGQGY